MYNHVVECLFTFPPSANTVHHLQNRKKIFSSGGIWCRLIVCNRSTLLLSRYRYALSSNYKNRSACLAAKRRYANGWCLGVGFYDLLTLVHVYRARCDGHAAPSVENAATFASERPSDTSDRSISFPSPPVVFWPVFFCTSAWIVVDAAMTIVIVGSMLIVCFTRYAPGR